MPVGGERHRLAVVWSWLFRAVVRDLLERALSIRERAFGPDHVLVAATLNKLGNTLGSLGEGDRQRTLLERALRIKETTYGPDHLESSITRFNYAVALMDSGTRSDALREMSQAANGLASAWGAEHPRARAAAEQKMKLQK